MSANWGLLLLTTTLIVLAWYFGDRMLLRPALRQIGTPLPPAVSLIWRCMGLGGIIYLTVALMNGNPFAIAANVAVAIMAYLFVAATIWLIAPRLGQGVPDIPEAESYDSASRLVATIRASLQHAPISAAQASSIKEQANAVPCNIAENLRKLARLRQIGRLISGAGRTRNACDRPKEVAELRALERQLTVAIEGSLQVLMGIPVSLMKVELARDDRAVARILADLAETNLRLTDLAESWEEVNRPAAIINSATRHDHSGSVATADPIKRN